LAAAEEGGAVEVDDGCCDKAAVEVALLAVDEEMPFDVPLVVAALGVSVVVERLLLMLFVGVLVPVVWMDWFDDDLLEPPTNRLKREFMLDMSEAFAQAKSGRSRDQSRGQLRRADRGQVRAITSERLAGRAG
jgi:hypothetical protein